MTTYRFTGLNAVAAQHLVEASALDTLIGLRQTLDGDAYEQRRVDGLAANEHAAWRD